MTLPIITRYVKIEEPSSDGGDAYATVTYSTVEASARAHISAPSSQNAGDRWQSTDAVLYVDDTTTVPADGRVTDLTTGAVYAVLWTEMLIGLGLDHRRVGLRTSVGAPS